MTTSATTQVIDFIGALFPPGDLVEVRLLPSGEQLFVPADRFSAQVIHRLGVRNAAGQNIYIGGNPRCGPGGTAKDVALARCVFADFDGCAVAEALRRVDEAALPRPTVIVESGHGAHVWWRLDDPITDLPHWTARQKAIIATLDSDKAIHDPPRVMRLPGFMNVKSEPHVPCTLVDANPQRAYRLSEFPEPAAAEVARTKNAAPIGQIIPEGERNATLMSIAGTMRQRGMSESAIRLALLEENRTRCRPPLPEDEVCRIAGSAARYAPGDRNGASWPCTDTGNAQRLVHRHGHDLLYCEPLGGWLIYDGRRWLKDEALKIEKLAVETVRAIYGEAEEEENKDRRKHLADWARASESRQRITAMVSLARHMRPAQPQQFDQDHFKVNILNGTLDLESDELGPHERADLITKLAPVKFDTDARLPLWDKVVNDATGGFGSDGDPTLIEFLQTALGYSITGDVRQEKLFFVHGPTASVKSTIIEAVKATLGDYAATASFETFLHRRQTDGAAPSGDIARLAGSRFVSSIEVDEGKKLAEGLLRMVSGRDTMTVRHLYAKPFEFKPTFKLWLVANTRPRINADDSATWRRIVVVPFVHQVPEDEMDPEVKEKLTTPAISGAAILAWLVNGFRRYRKSGLQPPPVVKEAISKYRRAMDDLGDFIDDCLTFENPEAWTKSADLTAALKDWSEENGRYAKPRKLQDRLKKRGCFNGRRGEDRGWLGVSIRNTDP